jgi:hypothetical protein
MRVSREWRDLLQRKRFGYGHELDSTPPAGGLALFCPACPQPEINIPQDWKNDSPVLVSFYSHILMLTIM